MMNQSRSKPFLSISAFVPDLADTIFIVVLVLAVAAGSQMLSIDSDLGRHLTIGNYILDNRVIPTRDLFSHTLSQQARPPYEWLSQVLFALAYRLLGLDGVILLTALIIAITFTLLYQFANRRCGSPMIAFLITFLALGASSIHWLPRPHIITFLFLAIWIEKLEQLRRGENLNLFTFPLIMLFWANLHGGFVFGILAWCAYLAGGLWTKWRKAADEQAGRKLLIVGLMSIIASVVTPGLWRNWEAVLNNRSSFILSRTVETMPPNLLTAPIFPFTIFLLLTALLFLLNHRTLSASQFFLLTGLGTISLLMARNIPLFVIACTPIASELTKMSLSHWKAWKQIEDRFSGFRQQSQWRIAPLTVFLLLFTFFASQHFGNDRTIFHFSPQVFPVQAMNWLEAHPQGGNMFNEFNWGGYILYRSWPQKRVFVDSQSDFYGEALMMDYQQIATAKGDWQDLLKKYEVSWAIIPADWILAKELQTEGWTTIYQDETAVILVSK